MRVRIGTAAFCCASTLIIGGCADTDSQPDAAATPIVIDPAMGETFTPEPVPSQGRFLTADQVWQGWDHVPVPDSIPAAFGALTLLTGRPGSPGVEARETGTPVWAFQENDCIGRLAWRGAEPPTTSAIAARATSGSCTTWSFFNAKTGAHIDTYSVPDTPSASTGPE